MPNAAAARPASLEDGRLYHRVPVDLLGRFMLESHAEYPCRTETMSPGDLVVTSPVAPRLAERVIFYLDHLGRIEASVERVLEGGFAAVIKASDRKREKLAAQLVWLANRHELNMPEDRRHERVAPRDPTVEITLADERRYIARIIDLSLSGAAVQCAVRPAIGTRVTLGTTPGRVVRLLEDGVAIEFARLQDPSVLVTRNL